MAATVKTLTAAAVRGLQNQAAAQAAAKATAAQIAAERGAAARAGDTAPGSSKDENT